MSESVVMIVFLHVEITAFVQNVEVTSKVDCNCHVKFSLRVSFLLRFFNEELELLFERLSIKSFDVVKVLDRVLLLASRVADEVVLVLVCHEAEPELEI